MKSQFTDLFDMARLEDILKRLAALFDVSASIGDLEGNRLLAVRDRRLCLHFHQAHEVTAQVCRETRNHLRKLLKQKDEAITCRCRNGLADAAAPIRIHGKHVANLYVGQFFVSPPDRNHFRQQARKYGFNEDSYLKALDDVPVHNPQWIEKLLQMLTLITRMLGENGRDVLRQKEITRQYRESMKRFQLVMDSLDALVYATRREDHTILFVNKRVHEIFGDVLGQTCYEAMQINRIRPCSSCSLTGETDRSLRHVEMQNSRNKRWYDYRIRPIEWPNEGDVNIVIATDITEEKKKDEELDHYRNRLEDLVAERTRELNEAKKKLEFLSFRDPLTGLYNRRFVEEEMKRLNVSRNHPVSLIMMDVDGLKVINDAFGHIAGDELLRKAARSMRDTLRADDILGRLAGDEFLLLLPQTDEERAERIVGRLRKNIAPERVQGLPVFLSYGIVTQKEPEDTMEYAFRTAEDRMYRDKIRHKEKRNARLIEDIREQLFFKSPAEREHALAVARYSHELGKALDLPDSRIDDLTEAASLHDIGKIALEPELLNRIGPLNREDFARLESHPEIGYRILSAVRHLSPLAEIVLHHHESWDGRGYPKGLAGKEIPYLSRIIAVAEAFDDMTRNSCYGKARHAAEALAELRRCAGTRFDPEIVEAFTGLFAEENLTAAFGNHPETCKARQGSPT